MLTKDVVKAIQAKFAYQVEGEDGELKERFTYSQAEVKAFVNAFEEVVVEALERGEDVALKGFVSFTSKEVEERTAKNPQDGSEVVVPAHRKATASLAKALRKF